MLLNQDTDPDQGYFESRSSADPDMDREKDFLRQTCVKITVKFFYVSKIAIFIF
jgi:hypothetical protein